LVPLALGVAAIDLFRRTAVKAMREPTRSFVAIGVVLYVRQLLDAPRLVVLALSIETGDVEATLIGGIIGLSAGIAMGWSGRDDMLEGHVVRAVRLTLAAIVSLAAFLSAASISA
ncbi:MAG: hypothetical protein WA985_10355, partial [Erythrobacter sp.]